MNPVIAALKTITVHIIDDSGHVNPDKVPIHAHLEEVQWVADQHAATIVFTTQGTPFQDYAFYVPTGGSVSSGDIKNGVVYGSYKYTVAGPNGGTDPEVIIHG